MYRSEHDQELDSLLVGPIPQGVNKFTFEADPPNLSKIPDAEILGVTVILLSCSYDGREFVRVGYYVNNEYTDEALIQEPPAKPVIDKIQRNILAEKPRVTRFAIKWDSEESAPPEYPPDQPEADAVEEDGFQYGAEEAEEEEPLEAEADNETTTKEPEKIDEDDAAMTDAPQTEATAKDEDAVSEAGSEDLEAESSGSEDEEEEDEEAEVEGEADGEANDDAQAPSDKANNGAEHEHEHEQNQAEGSESMTDSKTLPEKKATQDVHSENPSTADVMVH